VVDVWQPTPQRKVILNLPATVEMATPNVYADQIEWMLPQPEAPRRDRDHQPAPRTTTAAPRWRRRARAMAGADRVEGTLFGNGERTGNVDIVTLALNLYTPGRRPAARLLEHQRDRACVEHCNQLPVHPRHPYVAASWCSPRSPARTRTRSRRASRAAQANGDALGRALPADRPGRRRPHYEAVIRVNSQSGKGGVAYLLERDYGLELPRCCRSSSARWCRA
jgi:2-isopropylmalate synthase